MTVPTLTQHRTSSSQAGTAMSLAFSGAVAAGDLLIADNWIGFEPGTTVISDTVNGTYTQDRNQILAGDQDQTFVASFVGSASGTPTVSTSNPNSGWCGLAISDWAPGAGNTWSAAAQKLSANATSTSPNSGSITTTTATALIHTAVGFQPNTFTTSSAGSTTLQDVVKDPGAANTWLANGSQLVTSISSYAGTLSLSASDEWAAIVVAYPYTTSGGGTSANLTGQTSTFGEGAIARGISDALTGQTATFAQGVPTRALSAAITAQTATFALGALTPSITYSVAGQPANFSQGTLSPALAYGLTAVAATFAEGTITASTGGNVTLTLAGQTAAFSEGALAPAVAASLTAQTATFAEGAIARAIACSVTGQTITSSEGTITPAWGGSITLAGQTATFAEGIVARGVTATLVGQSITSSEGTVGRSLAYAVAGQVGTFAEGTITPTIPGNVTIQIGSITAVFQEGALSVSGGGGLQMPALIGLNYYEALLILEDLGIYQPLPAYAFAPSSISVAWQKANSLGGLITAQSIAAGVAVKPNAFIQLTVSTFPFGSSIDMPADWKQVN